MTDTMIPQTISTGQTLNMFNQSLHQGWFLQVLGKLTRRCFCLDDLKDTLRQHPVESSRYVGLQTVAIRRIHGTLGRSDEFDAEFHPTQERSRARWMDIALEKLRGRDLPPVELIEVAGNYYVRDGHHRISVSRDGTGFYRCRDHKDAVETSAPVTNQIPKVKNFGI